MYRPVAAGRLTVVPPGLSVLASAARTISDRQVAGISVRPRRANDSIRGPDLSVASHPQPIARAPLLFISAAEQSADVHGASLIRATKKLCPDARFVGVAGPKMVDAGCEPIYDMTRHSAMLLGAIANAARGIAMLETSERHLLRYPFDAAVVIDSPVLHLPLAGRAQAAAVPVLYYIAPQLWAWGANRIHKLRNRVDHVAVILPFEEEYFRSRGVDATFVGHPLADEMDKLKIDEGVVAGIGERGRPVVALLPGSRKHVVKSVLPGQMEVAQQIAGAIRGVSFGVSVANPQVAPIIEDLVSRSGLSVRQYPKHHHELVKAADLVLVASGTTALEVAFHERPMLVMYNSSRLLYHLVFRWMISMPHLSLPNILAGKELVPEFMPYFSSTEPIAAKAIELLRSDEMRSSMSRDLAELVKPLRNGRAAQQTATMLLKMADENRSY
ncbi:MAG: lipid-A-disaccharide synthase [Planctomycetes bacterium]|nr:lipid-A-disaccharide synthase [Planctomycetota bacterium]